MVGGVGDDEFEIVGEVAGEVAGDNSLEKKHDASNNTIRHKKEASIRVFDPKSSFRKTPRMLI